MLGLTTEELANTEAEMPPQQWFGRIVVTKLSKGVATGCADILLFKHGRRSSDDTAPSGDLVMPSNDGER